MRDYEREYDREGYEEDEYDDYEEEGGEEQEEEERKPTKEEQDFLKLREQLKERFRKDLKKESAKVLGHTSRSQDKKTPANDKFGSFFGPSQPAIAQRVIAESRSIRETQHITTKIQSSSSNKKNSASISSEMKTNQQCQRPKVVNEIKRKAQTLKDTRDYSFLLSDDADMPVPEKDKSATRMASVTNGRLAQASLKNKLPISNPERQNAIRHHSRNSTAANRPMPAKGVAVKEAFANRPRLPSSELRKAGQNIAGNGSARPAGKIMPSKVPPRAAITNRPQPKVTNGSTLERKPSAKPQSTTQNHFAAHRKVSQVPDKVLTTKKQPEVSLKHQPPKRNPTHGGVHEERLKKKPLKRHSYSDDEDEEAINMIRQMFRYDPRKFTEEDGDDSDMEVGFDIIQKEERKSAKIGRMEDEVELRRIEEEERRERMRKKQKLSHHR